MITPKHHGHMADTERQDFAKKPDNQKAAPKDAPVSQPQGPQDGIDARQNPGASKAALGVSPAPNAPFPAKIASPTPSKLEIWVKKRTVEQKDRHGVPADLKNGKTFMHKDEAFADAMQKTHLARDPNVSIKPHRYLTNVAEELSKAIKRRQNFYDDMMLHYGKILAEIKQHLQTPQSPHGPLSQQTQAVRKTLGSLPSLHPVKVSLKRDLALLREDAALMQSLVHNAQPLTMQLRPGTFESMRVEADQEKIATIVYAEHIEANKPTFTTMNDMENKRAKNAFADFVHQKSQLAALAFSHPALHYDKDTVDKDKLRQKGQDIALILKNQKVTRGLTKDGLKVNAPQMKSTRIDQDSLDAFALAQLSKVSFTPFAMETIGYGLSSMIIKTPEELMSAQQALKDILTTIDGFNQDRLLRYTKTIEMFIDALNKDIPSAKKAIYDLDVYFR